MYCGQTVYNLVADYELHLLFPALLRIYKCFFVVKLEASVRASDYRQNIDMRISLERIEDCSADVEVYSGHPSSNRPLTVRLYYIIFPRTSLSLFHWFNCATRLPYFYKINANIIMSHSLSFL